MSSRCGCRSFSPELRGHAREHDLSFPCDSVKGGAVPNLWSHRLRAVSEADQAGGGLQGSRGGPHKPSGRR
eukprot:35840-Eustigmatos_ZCMA.PRE.1